jgi:hypothetical protein
MCSTPQQLSTAFFSGHRASGRKIAHRALRRELPRWKATVPLHSVSTIIYFDLHYYRQRSGANYATQIAPMELEINVLHSTSILIFFKIFWRRTA